MRLFVFKLTMSLLLLLSSNLIYAYAYLHESEYTVTQQYPKFGTIKFEKVSQAIILVDKQDCIVEVEDPEEDDHEMRQKQKMADKKCHFLSVFASHFLIQSSSLTYYCVESKTAHKCALYIRICALRI